MSKSVTIADLASYSRSDLVDSLTMLRQYRRMVRSLGKRASLLFARLRSSEVRVRGEIAPNADRNAIVAALAEKFPDLGLADLAARIEWRENAEIEGGARLFVDDEMIDCSYQRIRTKLLS